MRLFRWAAACVALSCVPAAPAGADWQVKPFFGLSFGGDTTFVDLENAAGGQNPVLGASGGWLGEVIGVEGDYGLGPGFFEAGNKRLVQSSRVTTFTGNVIVAVPERVARYTLRPYFVGGGGLVHVQIQGRLGGIEVSSTRPAIDLGGGVTGFLNERWGLGWEVRHFRTVGESGAINGLSFGEEHLSFWRATMAVAFRY